MCFNAVGRARRAFLRGFRRRLAQIHLLDGGRRFNSNRDFLNYTPFTVLTKALHRICKAFSLRFNGSYFSQKRGKHIKKEAAA